MASGFEVTDRSHSKILLHELNEQRIQGVFCDVTIVVGESKFKAHKNVLAAFSLYFKELLASPSLWARDPVLELREMEAGVFAKILHFLYSSRVVVERLEEASELATAGHRLGIRFLEELVEVASQTRSCPDRLVRSSAQSPLSHSSDFSQGTKEDNPACTASKSLEDGICPVGLWPTDSFFTSRPSRGTSFPIDLTASASRRPGEAERPPSVYHSQTPESTGNHSSEHSRATSTDREDAGPPLGQDASEPRAHGSSPLNGLFHGAFLKGASPDRSEEAAKKRLYTLSTAAFRGLGFSVEEAAPARDDPTAPPPPPPKEPPAAGSPPVAGWGRPPAEGTPAEAPPEPPRCGPCARSFAPPPHRSGKALSCRHCRKPFVHVKRLHTHQTLCRRAGRSASASPHRQRPQEEPGAAVGSTGPLDLMLAAEEGGGCHHAGPARKPRGLPRLDVLTEEDHFMKVVDGHLLYFCAVCQRSYMTLSSLKRHANVHSWRRRYPCRYCDKVFALAEYRTKHEVWHTGERRYQCIFCWETFVTYYNLKTHQKSFHGVDPGLTISQKTPNGGYKPKLNAFKLYRLLPMRSQKRPYKTYSHSAVPANVPRYAPGVPAAAPPESDSAALSHASPAKYIAEGDTPASSRSPENPTLPSDRESPRRTTPGPCPAEGARDGSSSQSGLPGGRAAAPADDEGAVPVPQPAPAFPGPELAGPVPSVITYGRPAKSSVIVHSNAWPSAPAQRHQSSVIAYNGKCAQEKGAGGPPPAGQEPPASPAARAVKKQATRDHAQPVEAPSGARGDADQREEPPDAPRPPPKPKKYPAQAKGKTMTYVAKPACAGAASEGRGAPLCQITVRIGEEAMVKRRISESDLVRDKGSPGKERRSDGQRAPASGKRRRADEGDRDRARQRKTDYFLGNESGEDISDNDTDDNLWRPYYSYKPKRRAGSFHKTKKSDWRRKLRYRHSARWVQRAAAAKGPEREAAATAESRPQEPEPIEGPAWLGCPRCGQVFPDRASLEQHGRCHPAGGKQFSALEDPRKHEQAHSAPAAAEALSCRSCDKVFALAKTLKKHEKAHSAHSPERARGAPPPAPPGAERKTPGHRHACAHCPKTCKTAAALGRHQKRHLAEGRSKARRPGDGPSLGRDGTDPALEGTAGVARYSRPPEEYAPLSLGGDEEEGVPPNPGNSEMEQDEPTIAPYAQGHGGQETAASLAEQSRSLSTQAPRAGGEGAPAQESTAPPKSGDATSSAHQMLTLHGGEPRKAATPEMRTHYASAPEDRELRLPRARDGGSPGTSGRTAPSSPAGPEAAAATPGAEEASEGSPPRGEARAGEEESTQRDFHTLEPMTSCESFEEGDRVPELGAEVGYPVQEYPIPLITTGNCRSHADPEDKMEAFPPGALRFKEGEEDLGKVAFYQDPYQLVYGHQLLAGSYPYNFGHVSPLPVALNMVIRDEKGQQLPLLHRMFVYPTPCRDHAPPLPPPPPPPPLLGAAGNGNRGDEAGRELLAGEKGAPLY